MWGVKQVMRVQGLAQLLAHSRQVLSIRYSQSHSTPTVHQAEFEALPFPMELVFHGSDTWAWRGLSPLLTQLAAKHDNSPKKSHQAVAVPLVLVSSPHSWGSLPWIPQASPILPIPSLRIQLSWVQKPLSLYL